MVHQYLHEWTLNNEGSHLIEEIFIESGKHLFGFYDQYIFYFMDILPIKHLCKAHKSLGIQENNIDLKQLKCVLPK